MKTLSLWILSLVFAATIGLVPTWAFGQAAPQGGFFRSFPLDDRMPYQISVPVRKGITTILFPTAPQNYGFNRIAYVEAGSPVPDYSADDRVDFVLISHRGASYCSLRATRPDVQDTLSVIIDGKVYQLFLRASDEEPQFTVQFVRSSSLSQAPPAAISPDRIIACMNEAKEYSLLAKYYPDRLANITYVRPARIITYTNFRVLIDEVFRFNDEDTLVFRILLENQTDEEILYKPQSLAVRIEPQSDNYVGAPPLFDASVVDASGIIPPHSLVPAYFAVTGTPAGGRNNIDPATNKFTVLVPRVFPPQLVAEAQAAPDDQAGEPVERALPVESAADPAPAPVPSIDPKDDGMPKSSKR